MKDILLVFNRNRNKAKKFNTKIEKTLLHTRHKYVTLQHNNNDYNNVIIVLL